MISRVALSKFFLATLLLIAVCLGSSFPSHRTETVKAQETGICDRSAAVRSAILRQLDNASCDEVTSADLASIEFLWVRIFFGGLAAGDFDGLTGLEFLGISGDNFTSFPEAVFQDLNSLEYLYVRDGAATELAADSFSGLAGLQTLVFSGPRVTTLDSGAFNGLTNLVSLGLFVDELTSINEDTFSVLSGSTEFENLRISGDSIATIATNAFDDLTNLDYLSIRADALTTIQAGMFTGLGNLTWLIFRGETVTTVDPGAFSGIGESVDDEVRDEEEDYGVIFLVLDSLVTLQANTFSGLANLERLAIGGDMLVTLEPDVFNGLTSLEVLYLDGGAIATVPSGVFDDLPTELSTLRLDRGGKEILGSGFLSELPGVEAIDVWDESLTTIKAGFFSGLGTLKRLLFDDAGNITRVERGAFAGLTELTKLDLSNNKITTLPDGVFSDLQKLEVLELGGNPLVSLPAEFIASPPCGITTFDISGQGFKKIPMAVVDGVEYNILSTLPQPGVNGCGPDDGIRHLILDDIPMAQGDLDLIEPYKVLETLSLANTRITAEQAINVRRGQDLVTLKSLDLSHNDLSALNSPDQRAGLGVVVGRLVNLEELYLAGTGIDGDTALVIVQNLNPNIVEFSLAENNLVEWNHPDLANDLTPAWDRLWDRWDLIDLSDTAINSQAAGAIVPYVERTHEGLPEEGFDELVGSRFNARVTLDLSKNYLTRFGSGWLRDWEFVEVIDLSCNELTTLRPKWFLPVSRYLDVLWLDGNPLNSQFDSQAFDAVLPNSYVSTGSFRRCDRTDYTIPKSVARVQRLEPSIRGVAINPGRTVRLEVDVFGRQDILDNSLADSVFILWDDGRVGGTFSGTGRQVEYTAPSTPGNYTIIARVSTEQCYGDFEQCTARFAIKVNRRTIAESVDTVPINPAGVIPTILTDPDGTAYEVFTPVEGGEYVGDGFNLAAPAGAVPNGEVIGISILRGESASNVGQTHHRYTIAGDWYNVSVVDGGGEPISDYRLNQPTQVCIPLPLDLRGNVDDVAIVSMHPKSGDEGFTVLTSRVRLTKEGSTQVCGHLSALPANIAAARLGAPSALPIVDENQTNDAATPDTGGRQLPIGTIIALMLLGTTAALFGASYIRKARHRSSGFPHSRK